jgi:RND family efflux transporter MFP subunit
MMTTLSNTGFRPLARATRALALLAAAGILVGGCGGKEHGTERESREIRATTTTAALRTVPVTLAATGGLEAERTVQISTRLMGWVKRIHVEEGRTVARGDLLLSIDDTDLMARLAQAEAGIAEAEAVLANAEKMVERFQKLYEEKSVSRQQLDDVLTARDRAVAGVQAARARRDEVNVQLGYVSITAPIDGIVARKLTEVGNMASPGQPLLVLEQAARMKVVARLGERNISQVAAGDSVTVDITSLPDARFVVPVARVIPAANPMSRTYDIETYLDNPSGRLKSGMFARVLVPVGEREAIVVPRACIEERGQLRGVFVVDAGGIAHLRWVRSGQEVPGGVEILAGLEPGETVVLDSELPLVEGDRVVN